MASRPADLRPTKSGPSGDELCVPHQPARPTSTPQRINPLGTLVRYVKDYVFSQRDVEAIGAFMLRTKAAEGSAEEGSDFSGSDGEDASW